MTSFTHSVTILSSLFLLSSMVVAQLPSYYLIGLHWPTSLCTRYPNIIYIHCVRDYPAGDFKIHGLYPLLRNGTDPPINSPEVVYDEKNVEPFEMIQKWPNLLQFSDHDSIWKFEWDKHGVHSPWTQAFYFNQTLNVYDFLDLTKKLEEVGILPGSNPIPFALFVDRIAAAYGHTVQIVCNKNINLVQQVQEIRFNLTFDPKGNFKLDSFQGAHSYCDTNGRLLYPDDDRKT